MSWDAEIEMTGVREYGERHEVRLVRDEYTGGRWSIRALNEGRNNETLVDFQDVIDWWCSGPEAERRTVGCSPAILLAAETLLAVIGDEPALTAATEEALGALRAACDNARGRG